MYIAAKILKKKNDISVLYTGGRGIGWKIDIPRLLLIFKKKFAVGRTRGYSAHRFQNFKK